MEERRSFKRRGILAAAGAVVAGIVAKRASEPVTASNGLGADGPLILGSNDDSGNSANYTNARTQVISGLGNPTGNGFRGKVLLDCSASPFQSSGDANVVGISGVSRGSAAGIYGADTTNKPSGFPANMNAGVYGYAYNQGHSGVRGDGGSFGMGVSGVSFNSNAILGTTLSSTFNANAAILGLGYGIGVEGDVASGATQSNTVAVKGVNQSSGPGGFGVLGASTLSHGVVGLSGSSQGACGVVAVGQSPGTIGFQGVAQGGAIYAGYFYGDVSINKRVSDGQGGNLGVAGAKFAVVKGKDGKHRGMYAMESPECWFEDFGKAKLVNGAATVTLDPLFAQHIHTDDYHVFLTEYGGHNDLYVDKQTGGGFEVHAKSGAGVGTFSWRVVGLRNDITNERLPVWEMPAGEPIPQVPRVNPAAPPSVDQPQDAPAGRSAAPSPSVAAAPSAVASPGSGGPSVQPVPPARP